MNELIITLLPKEFLNKFKYIVIIKQSKIERFLFIEKEIKKFIYIHTKINNIDWYTVGLANDILSLRGLLNLADYTTGIRNVFFFEDGIEFKVNKFLLSEIVHCSEKGIKHFNTNIEDYCCFQRIQNKDRYNVMGQSTPLFPNYNKEIVKKIKVTEVFPCRLIRPWNWNPYDTLQDDKNIAFKAFVLDKYEYLFYCPLFLIFKYSIKEEEEYYYE